MQNSPKIETERFILRKFNDNDIDDLHEILKDEIVNTYLPWFVSKSVDDTKNFWKIEYIQSIKRSFLFLCY
ncbi:hypothetical protein SD457_21475 [Coprobacillaceae bacterium CR2/5/TPMF4]|nr:hypothetical protein SD457_21475 [Coprobacillaceae bacterium CR2/5/TPMF4]